MEDMFKRSLWMGSLEPHMNEAVISTAFEKMGETVQVKFVRDKYTKNLITSYCFVEFTSLERAENALKNINGKALPNLPQTTFHLAPSRSGNDRDSQSQGAPARNSADSLFIGGLSDEVKESDLFEFFKSRYSTVKEAKLCRTFEGMSKGFGFVRFFNEADRMEALRRMNGVRGLGSKPIFVSQATPKPSFPKDRHGGRSSWPQQWQHQEASDSYYSQPQGLPGQYPQPSHQHYPQTANQSYYGGDSWSGQSYQPYQYPQGYDYSSHGQSSHQHSVNTQVNETENKDDDDTLVDQELDVDVDKMNEEFIQNNEDLYSSLEKSRWHFVDSVTTTLDDISLT